jgi:hypothetical protein
MRNSSSLSIIDGSEWEYFKNIISSLTFN